MRLALPRVVVVGLVVIVVTAAALALLAFVVHGPVTKGALARSIGWSCWDAALALTYGSETEPATWPARSSGCVHRLELPRPS